ncbi:YjbE family putative metal transport protein [Paracraurococcus lichenis]|uniref:YjbE family putative metal transport protein n=1 Tax=Paracraurococcus lichenis TaxID=3064888 RepID=A0ABT9E3F9_9PROT|nr:YjbE family putative metal transport protein [Paracraurococcus sp. LOR1-02]MDO9710710.1 YjbE family putative metal transport protein [Paracraurococcus sp. LOR1-02]
MDMSSLTASWDWVILTQILGVNIVLSGDNAVLIALAAAGLPAEQRSRAIMYGMVLAVVLRVVLSVAAVQLLAIPGLLLVGGALLLWIAWGFFKELRSEDKDEAAGEHHHETKTMATALRQIVIADVSMSLDNVLAVAGAAGGNMPMLVLGLVISILLMGVAATLISKLLERYRWIAYLGVALIVWIGVKMIYEDVHRLWGLYGGGHAALQQRPALVVGATAPAGLPG